MLLVTLSIITIIILNDKKEIKLDNVSLKESVNNSFALMLEQTNGTYEETTNTEWPSEGYSFNKHMSGCIDSNGNTIENTLTYKNGAVKLKTKHNTYCYIYFDIDRPATEEIIATTSKDQLWDSTLEDDGYRYVGTNPDNYICFGTTDQEECMNDTDKYMYRIIGIFEDSDEVQHLKLIKKEALNTTYAWHNDYATDTDWNNSDLYKGINGSYFATNSDYSYMQDSAWNNLITTWDYTATNTKTYEYIANNIYGANYYYQVIRTTYLHELNRNSKLECYYDLNTQVSCGVGEWKPVKGKISLMYVSDYLLSLGSSVLDYMSNANKETLKTGWMHISNNDINRPSNFEWTMSRYGNHLGKYDAYYIVSSGSVDHIFVNDIGFGTRPVFYLESDIKLDKGTGAIDNPYTIETSPNLREYCEDYNNINECIQNEENNIEEVSDLWNSTLEEDGIRYVGTNPNNYICFGTTDTNKCISDTDKYMYRIIGIFEDNNGNNHLKLIKKEIITSNMDDEEYGYMWHSDYTTDTDWNESDLYNKINGDTFLRNTTYVPTGWSDKIVEWIYTATNTLTSENSGLDYYNTTEIKNIYLHEMNRSTKTSTVGDWKTVNAKIGLMYVSDYLLSLGSSALGYKPYDNRTTLRTGWMYISNNDSYVYPYEWTISRYGAFSNGYYGAWSVNTTGYVDGGYVVSAGTFSVRPVFYLTENIKITSGKGSITEPFIIS